MAELKGEIKTAAVDGTIIELVDRLLAVQSRCAIAENDLKELTEQFHQLEDSVTAKNDRIEGLEKELKIKIDTIVYQMKRYEKLEAEYNALKQEVDG